MTVAELIEELKKLPQDEEIFAHEFDESFGTWADQIERVSEWIVDKNNFRVDRRSKNRKKVLVIE